MQSLFNLTKLFFTLLVFLLPNLSVAQTIVQAGESIQNAINNARSGDTIQVASGSFSEVLFIDKPLTLLGAQANSRRIAQETILLPPMGSPRETRLITVNAPNVVINGFTLNGRNKIVQGIFIDEEGSQNVQIIHNEVKNFANNSRDFVSPETLAWQPSGIYIENPSENDGTALIQQNTIEAIQNISDTVLNIIELDINELDIINITEALIRSIYIYDRILGAGIRVNGDLSANISDNQIRNCELGIEGMDLEGESKILVLDNNKFESIDFQSIAIRNASLELEITNNEMQHSSQTLKFEQRTDIDINISPEPIPGVEDTTFFLMEFNMPYPGAGIYLQNIDESIVVSNNKIEGAYYGCSLYGISESAQLNIENGKIENCAIGILAANVTDLGDSSPSIFNITDMDISDFNADTLFYRLSYDVAIDSSDRLLAETFAALFDAILTGIYADIKLIAGVYLVAKPVNQGNGIQVIIAESIIDGKDAEGISIRDAGILAVNEDTNHRNLITVRVHDNSIRNMFNGGVYLEGNVKADFRNCQIFVNASVGNEFAISTVNNPQNQTFRHCTFDNGGFCPILINNSSLSYFDASLCWWGTPSEPSTIFTTSDNRLDSRVDFNPWIRSDINFANIGFQGDTTALNVSLNGSQALNQNRIQEAIDNLQEDGTIYVFEGDYSEFAEAHKSLTLQAENNPISIDSLSMNGEADTLRLGSDIQVNKQLALNKGIIKNSENTLYIADISEEAVTLQGESSWVWGNLRREVAENISYLFPVGDANNLEKIKLKLDQKSNDLSSINVNFISQNPRNHPVPSIFTNFSENGRVYDFLLTDIDNNWKGYWKINPNQGTSNSYTINAFPSSGEFPLFQESMTIVKRFDNDSEWKKPTGFALDLPKREGISRVIQNGFSDFTIAYSDQALNNQLIAFDAILDEYSVLLTWEVENILEVDHFELEKGLNMNSFSKLVQMMPNQEKTYDFRDDNLIDHQNLYYRLKVKYKNGDSTYSEVKVVYLENSISQPVIESIYPIPSQGQIFIRIPNQSGLQLDIIDMQGQTIRSFQLKEDFIELDLSTLDSGTYILKFNNGLKTVTKRVIKY